MLKTKETRIKLSHSRRHTHNSKSACDATKKLWKNFGWYLKKLFMTNKIALKILMKNEI